MVCLNKGRPPLRQSGQTTVIDHCQPYTLLCPAIDAKLWAHLGHRWGRGLVGEGRDLISSSMHTATSAHAYHVCHLSITPDSRGVGWL